VRFHGTRETTGNFTLPAPIFHEPVFAEGAYTTDPQGFIKQHPSDNALYAELTVNLTHDVVGFPKSRMADDALWSLQDVYGPRGTDVIRRISAAGRVVFHAVGDTGASSSSEFPDELKVSDAMVADCGVRDDGNRPSFFFHLGDLVYNFGEPDYYYDQFYVVYRNYPGPIIAIPGNHDSFRADVAPDGKDKPDPLPVFMRNLCSELPAITAEARSLHRTAMTAPGVYFSLDVPFVRILSLFSNALEDPGVISSEGGKWKDVPDYQLSFLEAQLQKIKTEKYNGCVLLAVHHPPFSYATGKPGTRSAKVGDHTSSGSMLAQIDEICVKAGVYPHAVLCGHVHNYQHYLRTIPFGGKEYQVPFVACGSGGHHINTLTRGGYKADPQKGSDVSYLDTQTAVKPRGLKILYYDDVNYGYLRVGVDAKQLQIDFVQVPRVQKHGSRRGGQGGTAAAAPAAGQVAHSVKIDLATHRLVGG
jgi:hypothetical protein